MGMSAQFSKIVILLSLGAQHSNTFQGHKLHLNYVKPYKNITCPNDPCLTLEEYRNASDEYFLSDSEFIFIPGDHIFYGRLRLTNLSNIYFHANAGEKHKVYIFVDFPSNLTFTASNNITLSHLTFIIDGSQTPDSINVTYATLVFQSTFSVWLSNLTFFGNGSVFGQSAVSYYSSHGWMENIEVVGATSYSGAALIMIYSVITLSGNNTFINNTALVFGGAVYMQRSNVSISGRNCFEGNQAMSGGAISVLESALELSGTALFHYNSAIVCGGAVIIDDSKKVNVVANLYFIENYCVSNGTTFPLRVGAAMYTLRADVYMIGKIMVQGNRATVGGIRIEESKVTLIGNIDFVNNSATILGGGVSISSSQIYFSGVTFSQNTALSAGGAMGISDSSVVLEDSVFVENTAQASSSTIQISLNSSLEFRGYNHIRHNYGGVCVVSVYYRSKLYFNGTTYLMNNYAHVGTIAMSISHAFIWKTLKFINNRGRAHGGAIIVGLYSTLELDQYANVSFEGNTANSYGGAIHVTHSTLNIRGNLTFYNNSASVGGAMFLTGNTKLILHKNTKMSFLENCADANGGAIFFEDSEVISQCHIKSDFLNIDICFDSNSMFNFPHHVNI